MAYEAEEIRTSQEIFYYLLEHHELREEDELLLYKAYAEEEAVRNLVKSQGEIAGSNIERYGNTSAGTLPLCVWDFEDKLKKGDKLIFTAFGAGFAWGAIYVKWGYDGKG